jgi:hypothetical protein
MALFEKVIFCGFLSKPDAFPALLASAEANELLLRSYTAMAARKGLAPKMLITRVKL